MQRSRSIVGIAVGVSSLVLVAAGMIAKRAIDQLAVTGDAVVAAKERELSFERLLSTLNDAETGQRGYLLSGSDEYLAPYEEALREVEGRINTVVARIRGETLSDSQLQMLRDLVATKLAEIARTISSAPGSA